MPLRQIPAEAIFPFPDAPFSQFPSRRSVVHSTNGMVACSQPLAAEAGQRVLKMGGNAADAAVAVAAALNITEPSQTGIGGDMFCLYWDAKNRKVRALNGSGRSPKNTTLAQVRKELGIPAGVEGELPSLSALSVTVPGAAAGWVDTFEKFGSGKVTLEQILMPAIELGEQGFPVSELSARLWGLGEESIRHASPNFREMLKRDRRSENFVRAPRTGEIMRNPTLAKTFRTLAAEGKKGFYSGRIGKAIIDVIKLTGGHMEMSDLEHHLEAGTEETTPISLKFAGQNINKSNHPAAYQSRDRFVEIWEHPPNGQGIVALMALGIFEELERTKQVLPFALEDHNSAPYLHAVIECLRIAFADANWWVTDSSPEHSPVPASELISPKYLAERAKLFNKSKASNHYRHGYPKKSPAHNHSDTVYFAVADKAGNGISFINSNYSGFGSALIPEGCGFTLQNRGSNFNLAPADHPNIYAGGKRPYHTIIPGMLTHGEEHERELHSVYGVMGGFMQPQGHMQVLLNMEVFGLNPQQALDAPRICIGSGMPDASAGGGNVASDTIYLEEGISPKVVKALKEMGHDVELLTGFERSTFGRGQVIRRHVDEESGLAVYSGGSDMRGDGCAIPV